MREIEKLWAAFEKIPFPSNLAGEEIDGVDPVSIDKFATGCIRAFLTSGKLDESKKEILNKCMSELRKLNPKLVGDSQVYFGKLYRLCDLVYSQL